MQDEASESAQGAEYGGDFESTLIHFPYDSIMRRMFEDGRRCTDFVWDHGDGNLVRHLADIPAVTKPTKQIGDELEPTEADTRFQLATTGDATPNVEVTVEFDSGGNDTKAFKKTLGYMLRGMLVWLRSGEAPLASSAFLVSTGERPYSGPRSLEELMPGLDRLGAAVLNFSLQILDFSEKEPEELVSENRENSVILLTVYFAVASRRARADFDGWMDFIFSQPNVRDDVLAVVVLFMKFLYGDAYQAVMKAKLRSARPYDWREIMDAAIREIVEAVGPEYEARGEARGVARGEAQARSKVLTSSLESVFGSLPNGYKQRISEASEQDILRWMIRFRTASSLDQIFDDSADT